MADWLTTTYTFLFTDIEGSTALWETDPDGMRPALARHDALIQNLITQHGGQVFKTVGDAFYTVFADTPAAIRAAIAVQEGLAAAPWETSQPLRVRMALHSGPAEERGGDFFGPALNRVARLLVAGHGGQILLSGAVAGCEDLPPGASMRALGEYRLKDLSHPDHLYQLVVPGLPDEFPPLRSLAAFQHNLPTPTTSFIGRERELSEVRHLLESPGAGSRLVTLTGPGGTGKTRLSIQVAGDLAGQYHDGVWLIELAPLQDQALLAATIAGALGVREEQNHGIEETLLDYLRSKQLLIVLDNCEHLVLPVARRVESILRGCPRVQILASSREALGIAGETAYWVPSLGMPDLGHLPGPELLMRYDAVRLFVERARTLHPAFAITEANAGAVAQICTRLDGIPLALELAAARIRVLPVEGIAARLDDRFRLLTGGSRTALPRQQTLQALIDWSYDLLTPDEQRLLTQLSVFAGGWTLEAAEAVADRDSDLDVLDGISQLANKSLLVLDDRVDPPRYRMLETIRQYGRERLVERRWAAEVWNRHLAHFLELAETAEPHLTTGERMTWLDHLRQEDDNLRAALEWAANADPARALRLAGALGWFWFFTDTWSEGRQWLEATLTKAGPHADPPARLKVLNHLTNLTLTQGETPSVRAWAEESLALAEAQDDASGRRFTLYNLASIHWDEPDTREKLLNQMLDSAVQAGDKWSIQEALAGLGWTAHRRQDYERAQAYFDKRLEKARMHGDPWHIAWGLRDLSQLAYLQGRPAEGLAYLEEAFQVGKDLWGRQTRAGALLMQGEMVRMLGDLDRAEALYQAALPLFREIKSWGRTAPVLHNLAQIALVRDDLRRARRQFREALEIGQNLTSQRYIIRECILGLGEVAVAEGDFVRAVQLFASVDSLLDEFEFPLQPTDRPPYETALARARAALDPAAWDAAWAAGSALSLEAAAGLALTETDAVVSAA